MPLLPFNGASPTAILAALYRHCLPEQVVSVQFRCKVRPVRSNRDPWPRLQQILSHPDVYAALGISSLPGDAEFAHARGLEVIGTLANLLNHGGVDGPFVENYEVALSESRRYLDAWFLGDYSCAEAYSNDSKWCDWFIGEEILDETVVVGNGDEWWLLAVTGTD